DNRFVCVFFFSSRRRHTRFSRDWSSDVCSSDLLETATLPIELHPFLACFRQFPDLYRPSGVALRPLEPPYKPVNPKGLQRYTERSEERRVGKECGSRRTRYT